MSTPTFINVASLVPDQHHCNLKLRVFSVETIAETIHPETGKIIQSAEAIVGDDTACILLNLKNDQVNLLARNARLQVLNANVNMYRGFMRLEVNEDEEASSNSNGSGDEYLQPSITAIMEGDDEDEQDSLMSRDGDKMIANATLTTTNNPRSLVTQAAHAAAAVAATSLSSTAARPEGLPSYNASGATTTMAAAASSISTATIASGSSSSSLASTASSSTSSSLSSRDQIEVEMRLGTGGSVPLMEYYRTIEFTYFSTVEPVGR
ncbi:hypothetical protein BGZ95_010230 [Linnemannia exigua]|uniref:Single-stranded DNA binding protein Ssb-like OB fold domain-containing protein n=1 Tax=Linnemannia exigua TaxID=604196 RepID=A0AAD4HBG8_9FUNG|nr:hypothetical protein BGZ95_010230 [Linnemannia exigua]